MTKEQALEIVKLQRRLINTKNSFGKELADALDIVIETVVVEREKIDNAIEEIKQEIQNGTIKITSGNEKLFNILKF